MSSCAEVGEVKGNRMAVDRRLLYFCSSHLERKYETTHCWRFLFVWTSRRADILPLTLETTSLSVSHPHEWSCLGRYTFTVSFTPSQPYFYILFTDYCEQSVQMLQPSYGYFTYKWKWEILKLLDLSFSGWEDRKDLARLYPQSKGHWHKCTLFEAQVLGE